MRSITLFVLAGVAAAAGCGPKGKDVGGVTSVAMADVPTPSQPESKQPPQPVAVSVALSVESSAFGEGGMIPSKYTSDGANVSPPLSWSAGPLTTTSYALVVTDADSDAGLWTHWVIWNIPATRLDENVPASPLLPNNAGQGTNSWKRIGYGGPQPPVGGGTHRYVFKVFALDVRLELGAETDRAALENAISGHVVASGELTGRYERSK